MINQTTDTNVDDELVGINNQYWVELNNALTNLKNNSDFKELIESGYIGEYVQELLRDLIDGSIPRALTMEKLVAVANLQDYFTTVYQLGSIRGEESFSEKAEADEELAYANKLIRRNTVLTKLEGNKDFELLIVNGYIKDYAVNQTSLLANDQVRAGGSRNEIFERLVGISALQNYLIDVKKNAALVAQSSEEENEE